MVAERLGPDVDLVARLGEREKVRAELEVGARAEQLAEEEFERPLEVGEAHVFGDVETLHLRELGEVGGVDLVAPVGGPGGDDAHGRVVLLHDPDLDGRRVRAQQAAVGKVKRVLLVAGRMVGRGVQRIKTMPLGFDVRPVRNRKSHPLEASHGTVHELGQRVEGPGGRARPGKRQVQSADRRSIGRLKQAELAGLDRRRHRLAELVQKLAEFRPVHLRDVPHPLAQRRHRAALAEQLHAGGLERGAVSNRADFSERLRAQDLDLFLHMDRRSGGEFPSGVRDQKARRLSGLFLRLQRGLCLCRNLGKDGLVLDRDVGEHLAVNPDIGRLQALDEAVVGHALRAHGSVEAGDPESAEIALARLAVAVGPVFPLHLRVLRVAEEFGTASAVALRGVDDAFPAGAAGGSIGCSWHVVLPPCGVLLGAVVRFVGSPDSPAP